MREILPLRFAWRNDAIAALQRVQNGQGSEAELLALAERAHRQGGFKGDPVWAYAELLVALARVVPWKQYIRDQDPKQGTCLAAAVQVAADALEARQPEQWWPPALEAAATALVELRAPNGVAACATKLLAVPLPTRITTATLPDDQWRSPYGSGKAPVLGPISVRLTLDGKPLPTPFGMKPNELYRIGVDVQWPPGQVPPGPIRISFKHDLPERSVAFYPVEVAPDARTAKTHFELSSSIGARELIEVRASLLGGHRPRPVDIIGYNRFEVMAHDPTHDRPFGQAWGRKFDEMLVQLDQRLPGLTRKNRDDFITLYQALCDYAQLAITLRSFPDGLPVSEKEFQAHLLRALLPKVGNDLQEGSELAGGELDLLFRAITLELKVEKKHAVEPANVAAWHRQPAHYGAARACPVSILCVLDTSPKSNPPGDLANYMRWSEPPLHGLPVPEVPALVAVLVIPVGFGAPHDGGKSKAPMMSPNTGKRKRKPIP